MDFRRPTNEAEPVFLSAAMLIVSILGLCGWIYVTLAVLAYYGVPKNTLDAASLPYPFIYLLITIYFCFAKGSPRQLFATTVILNLPVLAFATYALVEEGAAALPGLLVCLLFVTLWCSCVAYADNRAT